MTQYAYDVFISYEHSDVEFARDIAGWLRLCNFKVWLAEEQLVPGERFRVGLQQGIRESRDLVAILTRSYIESNWTQREIDLVDLSADRNVLAIVKGELPQNTIIDQVFLVNQRISWRKNGFDPEGMWHLHCGLGRKAPGPCSNWAAKGKSLIVMKPDTKSSYSPPSDISTAELIERLSQFVSPKDAKSLLYLIDRCLLEAYPDWMNSFKELGSIIEGLDKFSVKQAAEILWAIGHAQRSAVLYAALNPSPHDRFEPWSFLDMGCYKLANWLLASYSLSGEKKSEIWFSWALSDKAWYFLPKMAANAPSGPLQALFINLASNAIEPLISFKDAEEKFDYSIMITPWNHFHLCWLALRLGDISSATAHADALCNVALLGDARAGRFLTRLSNWSLFEPILNEDHNREMIDNARRRLGLIPSDDLIKLRPRLEEIWFHSASLRNRQNI